MNIEQTNQLLILIQIYDNRQIGDATVLAWHEVVGDIQLPVAVEAVKLHFRESTDYLLPAHVRQNAERIVNAPEHPEDDWGNELEPDAAALAARARLRGREIGS